MRNLLITVPVVILSGYLLLILYLYFFQDRMIFFPTGGIEQTPADIRLPYENVPLKTGDGMTLGAWYIPAREHTGTLLFCHGNAGNISHRLASIRIFHDLGLNVLIFDYRGYGTSTGKPTENGLYLDAEAAWAYLTETRKIPEREIVVFGRSLGGAVAAEISFRKRPAALILESTFLSLPAIGSEFYPYLPVKLISKYSFDTGAKIGRITAPILVIHSPEDEIVPYEHGKILFGKAREPKMFFAITGGHNDGYMIAGNRYTDGLRDFLGKYLPGKKL